MFLVKTYISNSKVEGVGLFAGEDITEGDKIWSLDEFSCREMTPSEFINQCKVLSKPSILNLINYTYKLSGNFFYLTDNLRYINHHAKNPNVEFVEGSLQIALRNIKKGEELLENYCIHYDSDDPFFLTAKLEKMNRDELIAFLEIKYLSRKMSRVKLKSEIKNRKAYQ